MKFSEGQLAEIAKLKADMIMVRTELEAIDFKSEKMLVDKRMVVYDLEAIHQAVRKLADFYYVLENRLQDLLDDVAKTS